MSEERSADAVELERELERIGVRDAFVFRRVADDRLIHVGGRGRGEGWAGVVEIRVTTAAAPRRAMLSGTPTRLRSDEPRHVFGPYWATDAVFVPVSRDELVLLGAPRGHMADLPDEAFSEVAGALCAQHQVVSPAKRLADELEALHAVQQLLTCDADDVTGAAQRVVDVATDALSCEIGVLLMPRRGVTVVRGPVERRLGEAAAQAVLEGPLPLLAQDVRAEPALPAAFVAEVDARSCYALPVTDGGVLLLVHTAAAPRGFTQLCQQIGRRLAEAAETVLLTAQQREDLQRQIAHASTEARRDPLTGLGNRLAWDEAMVRQRDTGAAAAIMVLDLDGLKAVNDELGHHAGDELLRAAAEVVSQSVRSVDEVARIGGDEFAILLHGADEAVCAWVEARITEAADRHPLIGDMPLSLTAGWAVCPDGGCLDDTQRRADTLMYARKRAREKAEGVTSLGTAFEDGLGSA